jgi:hypothetical protein
MLDFSAIFVFFRQREGLPAKASMLDFSAIFLFLRQREGLPAKASMLDFSAILENALAMRPDTNIVGGSVHINLTL